MLNPGGLDGSKTSRSGQDFYGMGTDECVPVFAAPDRLTERSAELMQDSGQTNRRDRGALRGSGKWER